LIWVFIDYLLPLFIGAGKCDFSPVPFTVAISGTVTGDEEELQRIGD